MTGALFLTPRQQADVSFSALDLSVLRVLISLCKYRTRAIGKLLHFTSPPPNSHGKCCSWKYSDTLRSCLCASVRRARRRFPVKLLSKIDYWPGYTQREEDIGSWISEYFWRARTLLVYTRVSLILVSGLLFSHRLRASIYLAASRNRSQPR